MSTNIDLALDAYVAREQAALDAARLPNEDRVVLTLEEGPRYARIVRSFENGSSKGAHSYVDLDSGNVLRGTSLKGPTKTVIGSVLG